MIKWRIPVSYVSTVIIISLIMCLTKDIGLWFILFNVLSGGLLFGAVFMATDPVTSPISHFGQVIAGILLGILTMVIRYLTSFPEGVLISILIVNIITIAINYFSIKLFNKNYIKLIILVVSVLAVILSSFVISSRVSNKELDDTYKIISKTKEGNVTTYQVSGRGYAGNNSIKLEIVFSGNNITKIEVISSSDTYMNMIYNNNYLEKIVSNQDDLDNLDTISGCTYTSKYLKEIVEKTKEDYLK